MAWVNRNMSDELTEILDGLVPFQNVDWQSYTYDMLMTTRFHVEEFGTVITKLMDRQSREWRHENREKVLKLRRIVTLILQNIDEALEINLLGSGLKDLSLESSGASNTLGVTNDAKVTSDHIDNVNDNITATNVKTSDDGKNEFLSQAETVTGAESQDFQREKQNQQSVKTIDTNQLTKVCGDLEEHVRHRGAFQYNELRKLIGKLFSIEPQMNNKATELRRLNTAVNTIMDRAKVMTFEIEELNAIVIAASTRLFDPSTNVLWMVTLHREPATFETFRRFLLDQEEMALSGFYLPRLSESYSSAVSPAVANENMFPKLPKPSKVNTNEKESQLPNAAVVAVNATVQRSTGTAPQAFGTASTSGIVSSNAKKNPLKYPKFCFFCKSDRHFAFNCTEFKALNLIKRLAAVIASGYCPNCFMTKHTVDICEQGSCKHCKVKHNSWICTLEMKDQ